ncbi:sugar ABC transporter permease [uncultured Sphaerochaeta sp.]|uniref:carbohydrate ABC transporter permease n=1 Tax=uncultured Sphaerochaeta sp. TaxID=886478 RepID=UPI0029C66AC6|nr:sugar ABC transporter permease [uncultured Sphaerochaeta sp.]
MMKMIGQNSLNRKYAIAGILFVAPAFIYYLAIFFYPLLSAVYSSFFKVNILANQYTFVGLKNYVETISSQDFQHSVKVTFLYIGMFIPIIMITTIALSIFVTQFPSRISGFFIVLFILPFISANVTAGMIWNFILDPVLGIVNNLTGSSLKWFRGADTALFSVVIVGLWLRIGFDVLILVGSIRGIPPEVYEASKLDGAHGLKQFFYITYPLINPTVVLVLTLEVIRSFRVFGEIMSTTGGGPGGATKSLMIYLIKDVFPLSYGRASAVSILLVFFMIVLSLLQRFLKKNVQY